MISSFCATISTPAYGRLADYGLVYDILIFERHLPAGDRVRRPSSESAFCARSPGQAAGEGASRGTVADQHPPACQNARTFFANFPVW